MSDLTKRLCRPGYDLQKEQAIQEAIIEIRELRAKVEEMEKQEPIGTTGGMPGTAGFTMACFHADKVPIGSKLYALPVAQPAPSINPAALSPVINWLRNGCDPMKAADELEMLAAAPEKK